VRKGEKVKASFWAWSRRNRPPEPGHIKPLQPDVWEAFLYYPPAWATRLHGKVLRTAQFGALCRDRGGSGRFVPHLRAGDEGADPKLETGLEH